MAGRTVLPREDYPAIENHCGAENSLYPFCFGALCNEYPRWPDDPASPALVGAGEPGTAYIKHLLSKIEETYCKFNMKVLLALLLSYIWIVGEPQPLPDHDYPLTLSVTG